MTDESRGARRKYFEVKLDPELEVQTQVILAMYPGHWPSLRALVQELYRRGLREFVRTEAMKTSAGPRPRADLPTSPAPSGSTTEPASESSTRTRASRAPGPGRAARQAGDLTATPASAPPSARSDAEIRRTAFGPPIVTCPRCGELVRTTAEARDAHFRKCPPNGPVDDRLVEEIRTRLLSNTADRAAELDGDLGRSIQIANVKEIASRQGITVDDPAAAQLLDRARAGGEDAGRKRGLTSKAGDTP